MSPDGKAKEAIFSKKTYDDFHLKLLFVAQVVDLVQFNVAKDLSLSWCAAVTD